MGEGVVIGVDAGGSGVRAAVMTLGGTVLSRASRDIPGNITTTPAAAGGIAEFVGSLVGDYTVVAVAVCAAGGETATAQTRTTDAVRAAVGDGVAVTVTGDGEAALWAGNAAGRGIVLALGTGSLALGRNSRGEWARAGGRGPRFSDEGSVAWLGIEGLRAVSRAVDGRAGGTAITELLAGEVGATEFADVVGKVYGESDAGATVHAAAGAVCRAAKAGDATASAILRRGAGEAAALVDAVRSQLNEDVPIFLSGGALAFVASHVGDDRYEALVREAIALGAPQARVEKLSVEPCVGAARFALASRVEAATDSSATARLEEMPLHAQLRLFADADDRAWRAALGCAGAIQTTRTACAHTLEEGGRLVIVGSGTSGRIADALMRSLAPAAVVAMAGGDTAVHRAVEGAEDDAESAHRRIVELGVRGSDTVIALSASGSTPYTVAALEAAASVGATTVAISGVPDSALTRAAQISLVGDTGTEVVAGSTRLAAGSFQLMVLGAILATPFSVDELLNLYRSAVESASARDGECEEMVRAATAAVARGSGVTYLVPDEMRTMATLDASEILPTFGVDHAFTVRGGADPVPGCTIDVAGVLGDDVRHPSPARELALKVLLNRISTLAMVNSGHTYHGLMWRVLPTNAKLRARALGIVCSLGDVSESVAIQLLADAANETHPVEAAVRRAWDLSPAHRMPASEQTAAL